ncbi:MAG: gliding motility-associated C-terminal domain-containing protein [Spirosomataceae bacterium]
MDKRYIRWWLGALLLWITVQNSNGHHKGANVISGEGVEVLNSVNESQPPIADCLTKPIITVSRPGRPNTGAPEVVCQDSLVQLNLKNFIKGSKFQWSVNGTILPNAGDSVFVVPKNQSGSYSCIVTNLPLCPEPLQTDPVTVLYRNKVNVSISLGNPTGTPCVDGFVKLTANTNDPGMFTYQWLRENLPVAGANTTTYEAVETGVYSLKITDTYGCVTVTLGSNVISNTPPKVDLKAAKSGFCKGESVTLTATYGRTFIYEWLKNGQPINGVGNVITVAQPGVYSVKGTAPNGCFTESMPVSVIQYDDPAVMISGTGHQLCPGASVKLTATGTKLRKFQWVRDGKDNIGDTVNVINAAIAGNYTVAVIDSNGCRAVSAGMAIEMVTKITVKMDSVPNFCGSDHAPVGLKGTPSGGVFAGNGVVNNTFDPKSAGIGSHTLTYTVTGALACLNGEARRTVLIGTPPTLELGPDRYLLKGTSVELDADLGADYSYLWTPSLGINAVNVPRPTVSPDRTTTYRVVAESPSGCRAEDSITLEVYAGIYAPEVFTPNSDGQNDTWELKGLEEYPEAEVTIFDRWGQAVFYNKGNYQKPFDGAGLPTGSYAYIIRTEPAGRVIRGQLLLIR